MEEYHNRRASLSSAEATQTQKDTVDEIIRNATQQALDILNKLGEDKESFRKLGLTFEEKAFYDILMHMRDVHNFEYGTDPVSYTHLRAHETQSRPLVFA